MSAVKVASAYYKISSSVIISDIYAKNLNVDRENSMDDQALLRANKQLYTSICDSIIKAAKLLGVNNELNFYVFSKNNNPKIPQEELHTAMKEGGAKSVTTDDSRYKVFSGSNDNQKFLQHVTNLHLATLRA